MNYIFLFYAFTTMNFIDKKLNIANDFDFDYLYFYLCIIYIIKILKLLKGPENHFNTRNVYTMLKILTIVDFIIFYKLNILLDVYF